MGYGTHTVQAWLGLEATGSPSSSPRSFLPLEGESGFLMVDVVPPQLLMGGGAGKGSITAATQGACPRTRPPANGRELCRRLDDFVEKKEAVGKAEAEAEAEEEEEDDDEDPAAGMNDGAHKLITHIGRPLRWHWWTRAPAPPRLTGSGASGCCRRRFAPLPSASPSYTSTTSTTEAP